MLSVCFHDIPIVAVLPVLHFCQQPHTWSLFLPLLSAQHPLPDNCLLYRVRKVFQSLLKLLAILVRWCYIQPVDINFGSVMLNHFGFHVSLRMFGSAWPRDGGLSPTQVSMRHEALSRYVILWDSLVSLSTDPVLCVCRA